MSVDLKTLAPDTTLPQDGLLFGADSQASANPSVYPVANVKDALNSGLATLASGPAISWDCAASPVATVTLNQNATLYASGFKAGGTYKLIVFQNATGGYTLSYGPNFKWPNDVIPTVSAGANAMTVIEFVSNGTYLYGTVSQAYDGSPAPTVMGLFNAPATDFTTLPTLTSMPAGGLVSRTGQAMQYDSTGLLTYAPNNVVLRSQEFTEATWGKGGTTTVVLATGEAAPDGTATAYRVAGLSTVDPDVGLSQSVVSSPVKLVGSLYVKGEGANIGKNVRLQLKHVGGTLATGFADITLTGSWQRVSANFTMASDNTGAQFTLSGAATSNQAATCLIWGAQLEAVTWQTTARDYVATTDVARFLPRFDTDPVTLQPKGLLIEGARTNIQKYSNSFDGTTYWVGPSGSLAPNSATSPDGTVNASLFTPVAGSAQHLIYLNSPYFSSFVSGTTYSISFFVKVSQGTARYIQIAVGTTSFGVNTYANFDLVSGVAGTVGATATSSSIQNVGNGYYRITMTAVATASGGDALIVALVGSSSAARTPSYTAVVTDTFLVYGVQVEAAAFSTSYIPTVANAVGRLADTFTITGYANRLVEAYWIDQQTGVANSFPETVVSSGAVTINPPTFGWVTSLRAYTNAYAGDITTPSWIDNSGTTGNRMYVDSTGTLTWAPHNLLLNSATLSTQTVTVTVGATNILSFYGTGSVTLSGGATGTLTGTGASNRVSLVITPTTTSLTLTVSGSVTQAQLERVTYQAQPRAYIPTTSAAVFLPRYDYSPATTPASPLGMLIEESRQNLLTYSQNFGAGTVTSIANGSVTSNAATAPDGTTTAALIIPDPTSSPKYWYKQFTASATAYSFSVYAKAGGYSVVRLADLNTGNGATFDLTTGASSSVTAGFTASSSYVGNGWWRFAITFTPSAGAILPGAYIRQTTAFAGDGVSGVYFWQAQVELGAFSTSPIPTTTAAVTRVADVVKLTGTALTTLTQPAVSVIGEAAVFGRAASVSNFIFSTSDGTANNRIYSVTTTTGAGNAAIVTGGSPQANMTTANTAALNATFRLAAAFANNNAATVMDGGAVVPDTSVIMPVMSQAGLGYFNVASNSFLNGTVRSLAIYNQRLPDATLQKKSVVGSAY